MANDAIPYFEDGDELTCTATANVTGSTLVKISGDVQSDGSFSVAPAGAGDLALGVAMYDCASGRRVTVHRIAGHHIMPITSSGAITANAPVKVAAGGTIVVGSSGDKCIGIALTSSASGAPAMIATERFTA